MSESLQGLGALQRQTPTRGFLNDPEWLHRSAHFFYSNFAHFAEIRSWQYCKKQSRREIQKVVKKRRQWPTSFLPPSAFLDDFASCNTLGVNATEEREVSRRRYQSPVHAERRWLDAKEVGRVDNWADISNSCWSWTSVCRLLDLSTLTHRADVSTHMHTSTPRNHATPAVIPSSCRNHLDLV